LIRGLNLMSGYDLAYRFSARPFLVGAFIALFVVQGAAVFPARRAAGTNIIEAIQHE
jgi:ABC-type lipoprotein release transport system permease subunit